MKSIFTRPLFVNPQAYLTIPELSYIQMAIPFDFTEDSYSFIINTSGRIEGKLLKTSNDYILHLDLYSIDGNCVLGEFYLNNSELNIDNFNLIQSKNIITLEFGEQSSGNITYPGLIAAWSAKGKTNDDKDRAILKDLTGNGHDITLNGFAFSEMSGYGGFNTNFLSSKKWITVNSANLKGEYTSSKAVLTKGSAGFISNNFRYISYDYLKFRFKTNNNCNLNIYQKVNGISDIKTIKVIKDEFTEIEFEDVNDLEGITLRWCYFSINIDNLPEDGLIIEQIPNYPDALVFDGVDDYGVNENVPILTDFTVIAKRKTFKDETSEQKSPFISKMFMMGTGAFAIEGAWAYNNVINFGANNIINYIDNDITFVTKNNYNEQSIISGSFVDNQGICIGIIRPSHTVRWKGAIYSVYLFDRSLDEQEIKAFIRKYIDPEYLLPSEIPTPDCYYDFSKGSNDDETRDTIKDYSGNGNDAVAHGFTWSGMSGYDGYSENFDTWQKNTDPNTIFQNTSNTVHITKFATTASATVYKRNLAANNLKVRVTGLKESQSIVLGDDILDRIYQKFDTDGDYIIPPFTSKGNCGFRSYNIVGECDITIELIPLYPDALVFDGVDDYISLDAFDSGFKTMFMVCNPLKMSIMLYDQRALNIKNDFALYLESLNDIAYNSRNINGTYINNKFNNYRAKNTLGKKQLIMVKSKLTENHRPAIGSNQSCSNFFANMALYKFFGFKEALTEEQIQAVIKKYNLLDGVDEIEVS